MKHQTPCITICNLKGGVGKTTLTANLATTLALKGKRVLVLDLDAQCNLTQLLGAEDGQETQEKNIATAFKKDWKIKQSVQKTPFKNVDIIAGSRKLTEDLEYWSSHIKRFKLVSFLLDCKERKNYDVILMDTHPQSSCYLQAALSASTGYIVPLFPEASSIRGLGYFLNTLSEIKQYENQMLKFYGIAVTCFDAKSRTHKDILEDLLELEKENSDISIFKTKIPFSQTVKSAEVRQCAISQYMPGSPASKAYHSLCEEVLKVVQQKKTKRKGAEKAVENDNWFDDELELNL